jgi:hypothetical protein
MMWRVRGPGRSSKNKNHSSAADESNDNYVSEFGRIVTATPTARQATADKNLKTTSVAPLNHLLFGLWIAGLLALSYLAPEFYYALLQEDRFVEWLTATVFLAAGILRLRAAWQTRRVFDALIGLFCVFVGGEEFSWGQRLLGFTPPDVFLEHNTQQELTLHNFADIFGKPKGVLILALLGYGVVLPAARRFGMYRILDRIGASAPHTAFSPWFLASAVLLVWYPAELTGEWVETLAASLFLAAAPPLQRARWFAGAAAFAVLLTLISARGISRSPHAVQCARAEAQAVLHDIEAVLDADADLFHTSVHKRLYSAIEAGYLPDVLINYESARCAGETGDVIDTRRRYGLDPWGMAYWVRSKRDAAGHRVITVYSFGPNRKRDQNDIASVARIE